MNKSNIFTFLICLLISISLNAQKPSAKEDSKKPKKEKTYKEIITKEAITDKGLFDIHKVKDKYYYEINDSLLGREMLMVTRIAKTASGLGFGGGKQNTQVLRWQKKDSKILLRVVSHNIVASDSLPVSEAVLNSNFEPILYSFKIESKGIDSVSTLIDVTKLFNEDVKPLGFPQSRRKGYKISSLNSKKSFYRIYKKLS